jgi:hypothetical protein
MKISEYLGLRDNKAFSMLVVAGFSAILIGAVFLVISILIINSLSNVVVGQVAASGTYGNNTPAMNTTFNTLLATISQSLIISGVSLIVVGVAVIIAVLFGMVGGGHTR